jgi:site-specific recombinase XerD
MSTPGTLAPTLQAYFTDRLVRQRQASPHTVAAYRDTCKLLLRFAAQRTGKPPSRLEIADLDAGLIGAFLDHLERQRGNSVRTRNARLAAIHSLFRFAALHHPQDAAVIQRVLAIPPKRYDQTLITYLTPPETDALLAAPDPATWTGRRDHALLTLAVHTGLRLSELTALTCGEVHLGVGAHVSCRGKGRKQRITPLASSVVAVLRAWLAERAGAPADPLFPTRRGTRSAPTPSSSAWPPTPAPPRRAARPLRARSSPRTCYPTPPRCGCSTPAWTPPSSPCGWATSRSPPPRPTSTPTSRSNSRPSPAPPPRAPHQAATNRRTRSSPSSKACDYVDPAGTIAPPAATAHHLGITTTSSY